jgi:succinate dehydrogenase hydrophobic anchor subunit
VRGFNHGLALLAVNAVPAAGWFLDGWSAATTLVVYWFENVAVCLCVAIRIAVHQRLSPRRGHFRYQAPAPNRKASQSSSFISGFLVTSLAFCAAHGIFLGFIVFMLNRNGERYVAHVDWRSVGFGALVMLAFLVADLVSDLVGMRSWSFLRIEQEANRSLGRVVVVHLTLIFGLFGVALTDAPSALFSMFVALKTLYSLSLLLPQWEPTAAPGWLSRLMNRLPNVRPGERFEEAWASDRADEAKRRERNEQPWAHARRAV